MDPQQFDLTELSNQIVAIVSSWGLRVAGALAVLIIGRIVAGRIRAGMRKLLTRADIDATLVPFLSSLVYYGVLAFVLIAVMGLFGIPTASFIAVLGAAGLAVGLALQGTLGNFASGVMLLVFRPFKVGDFVDAGGTAGTVGSIGVFSTTMNTGDNVQITIPNGIIHGQTIRNFSANPTRRNDMVFGVGYDDDLQVAIDTIKRTITADERTLKDPEILVAVTELGDSSVNIVARPWCKKEDYWGLRFDMLRKVKEELESAGCSIPFPQRDIHVHNVDQTAA
jgi:small conductance mechanosensitive channel